MELTLCISFLFSILLLLPSLHSSISARPNKCFQDDHKVLLEIKQHFNNTATLFSTWIPGTDCCRWSGVLCKKLPKTTIHRVNFLEINFDSVVGTLPSSVGDLPYLESIFLRNGPNITGSIPSSITKLTNLETINLSANSLSGTIPSFLSKLTNLVDIQLNDNHLTGTIPNFFGHFPNLNAIDISNNNLIGAIPTSLGSCPKFAFLQATNNMLSGPIPRSFGNLNFEILELTGNKFTGDASFLFGENKTNLAHLELGSNQFSFNLSKVVLPVGQLNSSLLILDLSHNMIFGEVPSWIGELPELGILDLSYNQLCGPIPAARGRLQPFVLSEFEHNKCLCGTPLPPCKS